jgi:septal ring factor EnvC (AmiA/AmiB activator)
MDDSDHKPKPIKNPLTETEARDFIADEVRRGLWKHVKLFSSVFGIANVVALVGIWFAVQNAAQNVVTQEASRILGTEDQKKLWTEFSSLSDKLTGLDKSLSQKEDHLTNLDKSLAAKDTEVTKLDRSISEREQKLAEISQSIQVAEATLNAFLSSAQTDATKLSGVLKQVSEEKASQLARVLASIPSQGSDIITKLDEVLKKLNHCFEYNILVASSSEIKK